MKCCLCPRKCNVDRSVDGGFCGAKKLKVACVMRHMWEEPIISQGGGSGAIFFSHCNLKCQFCQNWKISHDGLGQEISVSELANIFKKLDDAKVNNINLVTPSHYTDLIIQALDIYKPSVPVVWNSSGYESAKTIKKLAKYVDIYIPDLKYFDNNLAIKYSKAPSYFENASQAILQMRKNQPKDVIENGLMKKGLIVRHMILPSHSRDSIKILDWICSALGKNTFVSIMSQYFPCYKASAPLDRKITPLEAKVVISHAQKLGFKNGFFQDEDSASAQYIPKFGDQINFDGL